jgi:hypothetical protein
VVGDGVGDWIGAGVGDWIGDWVGDWIGCGLVAWGVLGGGVFGMLDAEGVVDGLSVPVGLVTVTMQVARMPPTCAVTRASPGAFPVTMPEELTVATAGFPDRHTTPARTALSALLPSDIRPPSVSCTACPGSIWMVGGLIFSD